MVLLIDDADRAPTELLRLLLAGFLAAERGAAAVPVFTGSDDLIGHLGLIRFRPMFTKSTCAP